MSETHETWASPLHAVVQTGVELAELEMISPLFDRNPAEATPISHRLLILSAPRSGSYFLCRRLWLDGLGLPMEYLNALHLQAMARRQPLPLSRRRWRDRPNTRLEETLCSLAQRRQTNGWFSLKLQPLQLKPWCQRRQTPNQLLHSCFSGWQVLPLLRRNWHRQLASLILSRATGAYDSGLIHTWSDAAAGSGALLSEDRLRKAHRLLRRDTEMVLQWLQDHPHTRPLIFEDLLHWNADQWQLELQQRLPSLAQADQAALRQGIGRMPLQRRDDPFRDAKNNLIEALSHTLQERPEASPPQGLTEALRLG